jgi:hypothetical protein
LFGSLTELHSREKSTRPSAATLVSSALTRFLDFHCLELLAVEGERKSHPFARGRRGPPVESTLLRNLPAAQAPRGKPTEPVKHHRKTFNARQVLFQDPLLSRWNSLNYQRFDANARFFNGLLGGLMIR